MASPSPCGIPLANRAWRTEKVTLASGATYLKTLSLPSPPPLDDAGLPYVFRNLTVWVAVEPVSGSASLTLTSNYRFQPVTNGANANWALTVAGFAINQNVPGAPNSSLIVSVVEGGSGTAVFKVSYGAAVVPDTTSQSLMYFPS